MGAFFETVGQVFQTSAYVRENRVTFEDLHGLHQVWIIQSDERCGPSVSLNYDAVVPKFIFILDQKEPINRNETILNYVLCRVAEFVALQLHSSS